MINSKFESIGIYLPENILTTKELLNKSKLKNNLILEKITGIKQNHVVDENQYSINLGENALKDAFLYSKYKPSEIDIIISCSITRFTDSKNIFQYEPSISSMLKSRLNLKNAITFDITNACAGMFTGIYILNSLIKSGSVKSGIVVSGESITYLKDNALKNVNSIIHDQFASLTVGDAGAAVIMDKSDNNKHGIQLLDLVTISEYNDLCTALPSNKGEGIVMRTDPVKLHKAGNDIEKNLIYEVLAKLNWNYEDINIFIPHQTSKRAIKNGARSLNKYLKTKHKKEGLIVVDKYGNTATTSHFITIYDAIKKGIIKKNHKILFLIQASGINLGHCAYQMDNLIEKYQKI